MLSVYIIFKTTVHEYISTNNIALYFVQMALVPLNGFGRFDQQVLVTFPIQDGSVCSPRLSC